MIDLHCHILPGLDDGALDRSDSLAMARQAADDGIEAICATPHIRHDHDVVIGEIAGRVDALNETLAGAEVPVRVIPGAEVAETAARGLTDEELTLTALGSGAWILLEPAPGPLADSFEDCVEHLRRRGYRALIAHPERHGGEDLKMRLARLCGRGALVQATAAFLTRPATADWILELAAQGLIHVLGSDAHSSRGGRPVRLSEGLDRLREVGSLGGHLDWIAEEAPKAIVGGGELQPPFAPQP